MTTQTVTVERAQLEQWLDALEDFDSLHGDKTQEAITAIKAALEAHKALMSVSDGAQPEQEPVAIMREMLEVQGQHGNWNYDSYMHGLYNGMEYMVALAEKREPQFRDAPETWLAKHEVKRNNFNSTEPIEAIEQPEQEPTNLERHERNVQQLFGTQQPKEPEQEPVAHVCVFPLRGGEFFPQTRIEWKNGRPVAGPLYTTPPYAPTERQRTWVGLTSEEKYALSNDVAQRGVPVFEAICEAEAKLKAKNERKEKNTRNGGCL